MIRALLSVCVFISVFATQAEARVMRVYLTEDLGEINVPVQVGDTVECHFPEPITHWSMGNRLHYKPGLGAKAHIIHLQASPSAPATTLHATMWNHHITARVYLKDSEEEPVTRVDFIDPLRRHSLPQPYSPEEIEGAWVSQVNTVRTYEPIHWQGFGHRLSLNPGVEQATKETTIVPFTIQNLGDLEFPISDIELRNHLGRLIPTTIVHSTGLDDGKQSIPGHGAITIVFSVSPPSQIATGWSVMMAPASFTWSKKQPDIVSERGTLQGRLALSVRFFGGAANLGSTPATGTTEWTSMQGIGARVLMGLSEHVSMEGSIDLARTGSVSFSDNQEVSETSGRLQAGGLLHTGKKWIPFGRLGLGARFSKSNTITSGEANSDIHAGFVLSFGGGLALRLTERLLFGLSVAYNAPVAGSDVSEWVEGDLSLGWLWDIKGN